MISKEAKAQYDKARSARLRDELRAKRAAHYEANKETILERRRAASKSAEAKAKKSEQDRIYRNKNKERLAERAKSYNKRESAHVRDYQKKYRVINCEKLKARRRSYQQTNAHRISARSKERYAARKDVVTTRVRAYYARNKGKVATYQRQYFAANRSRIVQRTLQSRRSDSSKRIRHSISSRVRIALRMQRLSKGVSLQAIIGCSIKELHAHLERQFTGTMSWSNYGEWHIDHIRPCASFDLTDPAQQRECFHFSNMQPLWAVDNLSKGARMSPVSSAP